MKVYVHIDRVVVDGLGMLPVEGASLRRAIEAQLGELMRGQSWSGRMASESVEAIRGQGFVHNRSDSPRQLGRGIAKAVHGSLHRIQKGS